MFGGNCKSYWKIIPPYRSVYSSKYPKDKEARTAWLEQGKKDRQTFHKWHKENGLKVEGFLTKQEALAALSKMNPPCEVEVVEYSYL